MTACPLLTYSLNPGPKCPCLMRGMVTIAPPTHALCLIRAHHWLAQLESSVMVAGIKRQMRVEQWICRWVFPFKATTSGQTWHFSGIQEICLIGGTCTDRKTCTSLGHPEFSTWEFPGLSQSAHTQGIAHNSRAWQDPCPIPHPSHLGRSPSPDFHPAHIHATCLNPYPGDVFLPSLDSSRSYFSDTRDEITA